MKDQPCRSLEFHTVEDQHYYTIAELLGSESKVLYESDKFTELEECAREGFRMLDAIHDEHPVRNNDDEV